MKIKEWFNHLFHFNKQERNGVFVLCIIIGVLLALKIMLPIWFNNDSHVQFITIKPIIQNDELQNKKQTKNFSRESETSDNHLNEKFIFNPNTISSEDALKLGFPKKLTATLINYRNKGGHFYKPGDLKKLYGLSPKLYNELEAYIVISNTKKESKNRFNKDTLYQKPYVKFNDEKKTYPKEIIEINTADSMAIVYLKGIGPSYTKRIIKYRNLLGGFHSLNQLKEIYGMTDSLFILLSSQIKWDKKNITKIAINTIDVTALRKHPYFTYTSAQAIINYRTKHGKLTEQDMRTLGIFNEEKLTLILPYVSF